MLYNHEVSFRQDINAFFLPKHAKCKTDIINFVPTTMKDLNYFKKQLVRVEYHIHIINILLTHAI